MKTPPRKLPVNLAEYEALARERVSHMAFEYIAGGAADEVTLDRNRSCFNEILLEPRVLRDVSRLDTGLELLGRRMDFPILLAPTAYHRLVHPEGEVETIRGAEASRATLVVSSLATTAVEEIAREATIPPWFQLYVNPDRGFTHDLVQRVEAAGCGALCLTVDTPVVGTRDRDRRSGFTLPPELELSNLKGAGSAQVRATHLSGPGIYTDLLDPALTWETVEWLGSITSMPLVLKGILSPEDARLAEQTGAAALIVSNHGARNLDTTPSTIEALPHIVEVLERTPVLLDGGVRRGTDIIKALALGARAVLIGRPYLWALAADGADGVAHAVNLLRAELEAAMALCGCTGLAEIAGDVIWNRD